MKEALAILICCASTLLGGSVVTNITLAWDYPTNELTTNITFNVYSATNVAAPFSTWAIRTNIIGTNTSVVLPLLSGVTFYTCTASNMLGESDPSNVAVAQAPRSGANLKIKAGP